MLPTTITGAILVCLLIHTSHSWMLKSSHTDVQINNTPDVSMSCAYDSQSNQTSPMSEILAIVIRKRDSNDEFETIAKVRVRSVAELISEEATDGMEVRGYADLVSNSFLTITWSLATNQTIGEFVCEIQGFTSNYDLVSVATQKMTISESPTEFRDILRMVLSVQSKSDQIGVLFKSMNDEMANIWSEMQNMNCLHSNGTNTNNNNDKDTTTSTTPTTTTVTTPTTTATTPTTTSTTTTKAEVTTTKEVIPWPGGRYSLFETKSGCPAIVEKRRRYDILVSHFDKSGNGQRSSDHYNVRTDVMVVGVTDVYRIRICHRDREIAGPEWPIGSYCLYGYKNFCPVGFGYSKYVKRDLQDEGYLGPIEASLNKFNLDELNVYCCRNDGNVDTPIKLPVDKPFHLHRYGSKCQAVQNMDVTEEWFEMDTQKVSGDQNILSPVAPYSARDPYTVRLCYYTKK